MKANIKYALGAVTATAFLAGCEPSRNEGGSAPPTNAVQEMKQDAKEVIDAAKDRLGETKEQFVAATQDRLNKLDQNIADLGARTESLMDDAKVEANKALAALRDQRAQLGRKFDELQKSSQEAWKDMKAGFESAYSELEKAYDNAKAKLSK